MSNTELHLQRFADAIASDFAAVLVLLIRAQAIVEAALAAQGDSANPELIALQHEIAAKINRPAPNFPPKK